MKNCLQPWALPAVAHCARRPVDIHGTPVPGRAAALRHFHANQISLAGKANHDSLQIQDAAGVTRKFAFSETPVFQAVRWTLDTHCGKQKKTTHLDSLGRLFSVYFTLMGRFFSHFSYSFDSRRSRDKTLSPKPARF
jgi:hypothetical protein